MTDAVLVDWWAYPEHCANGHPWGPGKVAVSSSPCQCPPARAAQPRGSGHRKIACRTPGCRSVYYQPRHEPGGEVVGYPPPVQGLRCRGRGGRVRPARWSRAQRNSSMNFRSSPGPASLPSAVSWTSSGRPAWFAVPGCLRIPGAHGRDGTHRVTPVEVAEGLLFAPPQMLLGGYPAWGHRVPFLPPSAYPAPTGDCLRSPWASWCRAAVAGDTGLHDRPPGASPL